MSRDIENGPSLGDIRGLDTKIAEVVRTLRYHGVETLESCEGGIGHSYPEPTVSFRGSHAEGFRALATAMACGLPVRHLRRVWSVGRGLEGPIWEMTFVPAGLPYNPY
jgi:hypothetical protein